MTAARRRRGVWLLVRPAQRCRPPVRNRAPNSRRITAATARGFRVWPTTTRLLERRRRRHYFGGATTTRVRGPLGRRLLWATPAIDFWCARPDDDSLVAAAVGTTTSGTTTMIGSAATTTKTTALCDCAATCYGFRATTGTTTGVDGSREPGPSTARGENAWPIRRRRLVGRRLGRLGRRLLGRRDDDFWNDTRAVPGERTTPTAPGARVRSRQGPPHRRAPQAMTTMTRFTTTIFPKPRPTATPTSGRQAPHARTVFRCGVRDGCRLRFRYCAACALGQTCVRERLRGRACMRGFDVRARATPTLVNARAGAPANARDIRRSRRRRADIRSDAAPTPAPTLAPTPAPSRSPIVVVSVELAGVTCADFEEDVFPTGSTRRSARATRAFLEPHAPTTARSRARASRRK